MRKKIAFISCSDLSRYFVSHKNPLLTHDDQIACDFLQERGYSIDALPWGENVDKVIATQYDALIVRSPWDYMDSQQTRQGFFAWLSSLKERGAKIANAFEVLRWNLDKHYLQDFDKVNVPIVQTHFIESHESSQCVQDLQKEWQNIVIKPCISAAAKDTFKLCSTQDVEDFMNGRGAYTQSFDALRKDRAFMIQPFIHEIETEGEWSLVFLNEVYSHSVLKLPKKGNWLVQDELGGSVQCLEAPRKVRELAEESFARIAKFLQKEICKTPLLYARVDIVPGLKVGEIELVEPELFFLDRSRGGPNLGALQKFYDGISRLVGRT